ncbi:unnamed protein product [Arctogadus glacialis]
MSAGRLWSFGHTGTRREEGRRWDLWSVLILGPNPPTPPNQQPHWPVTDRRDGGAVDNLDTPAASGRWGRRVGLQLSSTGPDHRGEHEEDEENEGDLEEKCEAQERQGQRGGECV